MVPEPPLTVYRAYGRYTCPDRRAAHLADVVDRWLEDQAYILTTGPAEPFSCPRNVILLTEAQQVQRQSLTARAPLHLWCYPLEFQLQVWSGGWDVRVAPRMVKRARYALKFAANFRRQLLEESLRDLIRALRPQLLSGPTAQPSANLSYALRQTSEWEICYVGETLARMFHWPQILENVGMMWQPWLGTGGLWATREERIRLTST